MTDVYRSNPRYLLQGNMNIIHTTLEGKYVTEIRSQHIFNGEIAQLVEQVKTKISLCIFSSERTANVKVTSKFHEKDRVVCSNQTLPTNWRSGRGGLCTGLKIQRTRLDSGGLHKIFL